ncbi:hypothetical protein B0T17DRAFT_524268 [Bombardia bombarda]|uniref:D-xylose 1-dehydrogenase (NADP(+), D-xylono-1,5-lactone-forming) n=1 Tax=Bombardia bombarda TaxID=252184 RepID=A0AA40C8C9_9PEZI|nr:hypothetical protein B0T17DRAFT_524268 [Bombardia bombarda]
MTSLYGFLHRNWRIVHANLIGQPAGPPKTENALKFGLLGTASIAPIAFITPARQHPEVIIQAVAARDRTKAAAFAKKYNIPQVHNTYQDILDDPSIDAVYIPLPNGLHFEWAIKALAAGKHVLLEKPSVSNAAEASVLFRSPLLTTPNPATKTVPVLLEAFHYRFQPSWLHFLTHLDPPNIAHASSSFPVPGSGLPRDDIRFQYGLSGGSVMDLTYTLSMLRAVYGDAAEPVECTSAQLQTMPPPYDELTDWRHDATFRFSNGGTATAYGNLRASLVEVLRDNMWVSVTHRPAVIPDSTALPADQETVRTRKVTLHGAVIGAIWHRVDVEDEFVIRKVGSGTAEAADGVIIKRWRTKSSSKAYTFQEAGFDNYSSEPHWLTYKHQMDAFVDRIRGRQGTGAWVTGEDSIKQMSMIDMVYAKAGLPLRPSSKYLDEVVRKGKGTGA